MKHYIASYRLHSGRCGTLHVLATTSCDALIAAMDAFGDQLCHCSARPAQALRHGAAA